MNNCDCLFSKMIAIFCTAVTRHALILGSTLAFLCSICVAEQSTNPCVSEWSDWAISLAPTIPPKKFTVESTRKIGSVEDDNESLLQIFEGDPLKASISATVKYQIEKGAQQRVDQKGCAEPETKGYTAVMDSITWAISGVVAQPMTGTGATATFTINHPAEGPPVQGTLTYTVKLKGSNPEWSGTFTKSVPLVPIDIREAWSDQIADVEANGMPNKTGNANRSYILMGVRADGKAHGKLRLGAAIPDGLRPKMLWRFQKKSGGAPEAGTSSYEQDGLIVRMTMDNPANADYKDYVVLVGFDANGDGSLAASEVSMTPITKHDPPGGGVNPTEMPFTFTVVSNDRYEQSRTENLNAAGNGGVQLVTPNAAQLLTTFCNGGNAPNASSVTQVAIGRNHPGLTHPVGIAFTPTAEPGQSVTFQFNGNTDFAKDLTKTYRFRDTLLNELRKPVWIGRIADHYFDEQGNVINPLDEDVWFSWTWVAITGNGSLDFAPSSIIDPPLSAQDLDMWVALGKVEISGTVFVKANWLKQEVSEMRFTGTVKDIYDFDYDSNGFAAGSIQIRPKLAAEVQAGYPALLPGGRVVLTLLNYDDTNLNLTYSFYGL